MTSYADTWLAWYYKVLSRSHSFVYTCETAPENLSFLVDAYAAHQPAVIDMRNSTPEWNMPYLKAKFAGAPIEVQARRNSTPDFETQSHMLRHVMPADAFIDSLISAKNDRYLTAQNARANRHVVDPLLSELGNFPSYLNRNFDRVFLWLGNDSMTPLHHDMTNNFLWQIFGTKLIRLVSPLLIRRLQCYSGVHSTLGWLDEQKAIVNNLVFRDIMLAPGYALFIPVGWFHCVQSVGHTAMLTCTDFVWPNSWNEIHLQ